MAATAVQAYPDRFTSIFTLLFIIAVSLFLQSEFDLRQAVIFLLGAGLGFSLLHGAYGFSGAWRRFIEHRHSDGVRSHLLLLALTSILFFPLLGLYGQEWQLAPALAPFSVSVVVGAFLFGVGMQLGSGCGSGTLYTVGGGHINMLITLAFFIVGATIGSVHLGWWLSLPNAGNISLLQSFGWPGALLVQLAVLALLYLLVRYLDRRRHVVPRSLHNVKESKPIWHRVLFGPWPLCWAVVALALFNLLTLLIAGHPWTITFAFGLWGAKIWSALGGDISSWSYWLSGYPAQALNRSVLADTTSIMDFGVILGAVLAAALAGSFAPEKKIDRRLVLISVIGGLLLGYGARLAFGCNIGALLAGISSGSLHGWLWLVAGFVGNWLGVKLRRRMLVQRHAGGSS